MDLTIVKCRKCKKEVSIFSDNYRIHLEPPTFVNGKFKDNTKAYCLDCSNEINKEQNE